MEYLKVKNWDKYQHYKHRNPPWIKLHYEVLSSVDWVALDDASRVLAIACMLIASRNDGQVPADPNYLQRVAYLNTKPNFNPLIECGFLGSASTMLADASTMRTNALPELETETELETERTCIKPNGSTHASSIHFEQFWKHWPVKRNKKKAKAAFIRKKFEISDVDELIADVAQRIKNDEQWKKGFIPHCSTYLNGERWEDDYGR